MTPDKTVRERWEVPLPHKEEHDDHWDQSEYKQGRFEEEVVELKMELIVDWRGLVDDSPVGIIIRVLDSLANEAVDEKGEEELEEGGRVLNIDEATVDECEVTDGIPLVWIVVMLDDLVVVTEFV